MCWYSADHADQILQAEAGQRLVVRKVHEVSWAVKESDLERLRPTPVCMLDGTKVMFRFSQPEHNVIHPAEEAEAVFRMQTTLKRDVFQFADGREISMNALPTGLAFDVLQLPAAKSADPEPKVVFEEALLSR